jgi:hypothetical protein
VFQPLTSAGGTTISFDQEVEIPTPTIPKLSEAGNSNEVCNDTAAIPDADMEISVADVSLSPNALSLFLCSTLLPMDSSKESFFPSWSAGPQRINHRPLRIQRVWDSKNVGTKHNPGMLATLLGAVDPLFQRDFNHPGFCCWPYMVGNSVRDEGCHNGRGHDSVGTVFGFGQGHAKQAAVNQMHAQHITADHALNLLRLLHGPEFQVRHFILFLLTAIISR